MARSELSVPARLYRGFPWLLACCGAVGAYLLMSGSTYLAVAELVLTVAHPAGVDIADRATLATFDLWFQFGSQLASTLLFWLWWRVLTPRQVSYARRGLLRRDAASIARRLVALALLGVVIQMLVSVVLTLMVSLLPQVMQGYQESMEAAGTTDFSLITVLVVHSMNSIRTTKRTKLMISLISLTFPLNLEQTTSMMMFLRILVA